jgi:hypothetical protein
LTKEKSLNTMQNLQDVFMRLQATKQQQKEIRTQYKDALDASQEYKEIVEKIQGYKLRKKQIEDEAKAELGSAYEKLEVLKRDMDLDKEMLTDIAITILMKGETVEVKDNFDNVYEPIFKVSFKKTNQISPSN